MTENIEIWKVFFKSLLYGPLPCGDFDFSLISLSYLNMQSLLYIYRNSLQEIISQFFFYLLEFPPFQHQILSSNLINVAATMAMFDHEFYVRVSALKCLGVASKISPLWEHLKQEHQDIQV